MANALEWMAPSRGQTLDDWLCENEDAREPTEEAERILRAEAAELGPTPATQIVQPLLGKLAINLAARLQSGALPPLAFRSERRAAAARQRLPRGGWTAEVWREVLQFISCRS